MFVLLYTCSSCCARASTCGSGACAVHCGTGHAPCGCTVLRIPLLLLLWCYGLASRIDLSAGTRAPAAISMGTMPHPSTLPAIQVIQPPAHPAPVVQPTVQPAEQNAVQPAVQPAMQPAIQPAAPAVQPAVQPAVKPAIQPATQAAIQPAVQPAIQPVIQPAMQQAIQPTVQPLVLPAPQPAASIAVPTGLFLGDVVVPLPQKLIKRLEFVEMRELLPEEWLGSLEEGHNAEQHCCNSANRRRKPPVTNIFTWLQGYASLVGALATAHPDEVAELMAYQTTILRCYRDFEGVAWAQYDRAYRHQAALSKDLNWSRINTTLYSLCFAGQAKRGQVCSHCLSNNHQSDNCPEAPAPVGQPLHAKHSARAPPPRNYVGCSTLEAARNATTNSANLHTPARNAGAATPGHLALR